eukprot:6095334-Prorocentrum_lima.AAC.1
MTSSLVGSEMCIRDRACSPSKGECGAGESARGTEPIATLRGRDGKLETVSYTHLTLPTICSV